jgi:hypothetical protein
VRRLLAVGRLMDDSKCGLADILFERMKHAARNVRHDLAECFLLADVKGLELCEPGVGNRKHYKRPGLSIGSDNIASFGMLCHAASLSQARGHFQPCGNQTAPLPEHDMR